MSLFSDISSAIWEIFIEWYFLRLEVLVLWVVASSSEHEAVRMWAWTFDITDLDWEINSVLLGFKRSEQGVDVLGVIWSQSAFWILNFENSKVEIALIERLELCSIDLVLELGNTQVLDLNRVSHSPVESNRGRRHVVDIFEESQVSTSVQGFTD